MARKRVRQPLNIFLNNRLVGQLQRATNGAISFEYEQAWLDWKNTFAISLSLPLRDQAYVGDVVLRYFENLLPDHEEVRKRIAARAHAHSATAYDLLAAIGRDCVGALQILPVGAEPDRTGTIRATPISDKEIAARLSSLPTAPLGIEEYSDLRISLAGTQDKTALLRLNGAWQSPVGTTPTTHILKPQIGKQGNYDLSQSVENEFLCLLLLRELGLSATQAEIIDFNGIRALAVTRFDRFWSEDKRLLRVPQEDSCQALSIPSIRKYQSDGGPGVIDILELLKASDEPENERLFFFKAQIAFWLLGAIDGHAKNFSVFLYPGGGFRLTPLYDVLSAQPLVDNKQLSRKEMKLAMSLGDNNHYRVQDIQTRHFYQTAKSAGFPTALLDNAIQEIVERLPAAIERVNSNLPDDFPAALLDSIAGGALKRLAII